jgi:hypothetical protein
MGLLASVDDTCLGVVVVIRRIDGSRLAISPANCADAQSLVPSREHSTEGDKWETQQSR